MGIIGNYHDQIDNSATLSPIEPFTVHTKCALYCNKNTIESQEEMLDLVQSIANTLNFREAIQWSLSLTFTRGKRIGIRAGEKIEKPAFIDLLKNENLSISSKDLNFTVEPIKITEMKGGQTIHSYSNGVVVEIDDGRDAMNNWKETRSYSTGKVEFGVFENNELKEGLIWDNDLYFKPLHERLISNKSQTHNLFLFPHDYELKLLIGEKQIIKTIMKHDKDDDIEESVVYTTARYKEIPGNVNNVFLEILRDTKCSEESLKDIFSNYLSPYDFIDFLVESDQIQTCESQLMEKICRLVGSVWFDWIKNSQKHPRIQLS